METAVFRRVLRGYDPDEVDTLLLRVAERYEAMWSQNQELRQKTSSLEETIRRRDEDDGLMTRVLTSAQATAEEIRASAQAEAERTVEDARRNAEDVRAQIAERLRHAASEAEADEALPQNALLAYRDLLFHTIDALELDAGVRLEVQTRLDGYPEGAALTSGQPVIDGSEQPAG